LPINQGPQYLADSARLAQVQAEGSFELKSQVYANPAAYSFAIGNYIRDWRNEESPVPGFINKLDYIQALLRGTGMSKDTTPRGIIGNDDTKALQEVSRISLQNGVPFLDTLKELYSTRNVNTVKFSKSIATSIKLIDDSDAKSQLSNAYFQAYGEFPPESVITEFKNLRNIEAKKQQAKSVTAMTTKGDVTSTKTTTFDEGFTKEEQQQFLANYLVKNFDVATSDGLGGQAKSLYDQIVGVHRNNLLTEPDLPAVAGVIKNVLSATDDKVASEILNQYFGQQRRIASTKYLGIQNNLLAGDDVLTYAKPMQDGLMKTFGRNVAVDDKLIVAALNFKDEKGNYRPMNDLELNNLVMSDPRFATSPMAIQRGTSLADKLAKELDR
jgi:hypothetical protein